MALVLPVTVIVRPWELTLALAGNIVRRLAVGHLPARSRWLLSLFITRNAEIPLVGCIAPRYPFVVAIAIFRTRTIARLCAAVILFRDEKSLSAACPTCSPAPSIYARARTHVHARHKQAIVTRSASYLPGPKFHTLTFEPWAGGPSGTVAWTIPRYCLAPCPADGHNNSAGDGAGASDAESVSASASYPVGMSTASPAAIPAKGPSSGASSGVRKGGVNESRRKDQSQSRAGGKAAGAKASGEVQAGSGAAASSPLALRPTLTPTPLPSAGAVYPVGTVVVVPGLAMDPGRTLKFARGETNEAAFQELIGREVGKKGFTGRGGWDLFFCGTGEGSCLVPVLRAWADPPLICCFVIFSPLPLPISSLYLYLGHTLSCCCCCCFSHSAYCRKNYFTRLPIPLVVC